MLGPPHPDPPVQFETLPTRRPYAVEHVGAHLFVGGIDIVDVRDPSDLSIAGAVPLYDTATMAAEGGRLYLGQYDCPWAICARVSNEAPLPSSLTAGRALDPADRRLAFGELDPTFEGIECLVLTRKNREWIRTPKRSPSDSVRDTRIELAIDSAGQVSGNGSIHLSGNHALAGRGWAETEQETNAIWRRWLEENYPGFDVSDVMVQETIEEMIVTVDWQLEQKSGKRPDGKVMVNVTTPVGVNGNPFTLASGSRRTPVVLDFVAVDRSHFVLTWPDGWSLAGDPDIGEITNSAGSVQTTLSIDSDGHKLELRRELTTAKNEFKAGSAYTDLQHLFAAAVANDTQELVVAAP